MKTEVEVQPRLNTQEWNKHPRVKDRMSRYMRRTAFKSSKTDLESV